MKKALKFSLFGLIASLAMTACMPLFARKMDTVDVSAASNLGTATGYTKASDVDYVKSGSYVANWGARDEDCVFLTSYAQSFYTGSYTYETLSKTKGGTSQSDVEKSALFTTLRTLVTSKQNYQTSYNATRDLYKYTDCVNSNYSHISSFYSGDRISGTWDSGATWNREHTWPNSKGDANGNGENDIMMLRPTATSENGARGNKAYGTGGSYYDPNCEGQNVRGDCARIILYVYVRWRSIGAGGVWGTSGVMQDVDTLLKWMEEDPVDTWEMGRNDATQSIVGTRNVFVDYPEYAFQLFGRAVPSDMVTPSGKAKGGNQTPDAPATSEKPETSETPEPPVSEEPSVPPTSEEPVVPPTSEEADEHNFTEWIVIKEPTETEAGEEYRICSHCLQSETREVPALGAGNCPDGTPHTYTEWIETKAPTATDKGEEYRICTHCYDAQTREIPALGGGEETSSSAETSGCGATIVAPMFATLLVAVVGTALRKKED